MADATVKAERGSKRDQVDIIKLMRSFLAAPPPSLGAPSSCSRTSHQSSPAVVPRRGVELLVDTDGGQVRQGGLVALGPRREVELLVDGPGADQGPHARGRPRGSAGGGELLVDEPAGARPGASRGELELLVDSGPGGRGLGA